MRLPTSCARSVGSMQVSGCCRFAATASSHHLPPPLSPHTALSTAATAAACATLRRTPNSNYLRGVKWSPDGACFLTAADDGWCAAAAGGTVLPVCSRGAALLYPTLSTNSACLQQAVLCTLMNTPLAAPCSLALDLDLTPCAA